MPFRPFEAAYELLPCAVMITNDVGQYVSVNKAAEQLLGSPRRDILGKTVESFVAPIREKYTQRLWNEFTESGGQQGVFIISRPDGTDIAIRYSAVKNFVPGYHLSVALEVR
jgi:PAS domain S-box-containing protein